MATVLSVEAARRGTTQARVEMSNGDIYLIGFVSDEPLIAKDAYKSLLKRVLDDYEILPSGEDLYNYLSYRLAGEKAETPLFVMPDRNIDRERIGRRIRELRESKHMEAKKLARLADIDAANLSRIEQGKYSTGLDVLSKIALALDSKVDLVSSGSSEKAGSFCFYRRVWIIPSGNHQEYDPLSLVPPFGIVLWPMQYGIPSQMQIGDIVVFYHNTHTADWYSMPFIVTELGLELKQDAGLSIEKIKEYLPAVDPEGFYMKATNHINNWSEGDEIQLQSALARLKEKPTTVMELKLR